MVKIYQTFKQLSLVALLVFMSGAVMGQVFITELADPNNNAGLRYIELYNAGGVAVDFTEGSGWRIDKYTNASATVSQTLNLTGTIPSKGFYIIATGVVDTDFQTAYGVAPDQFDGADNDVAGSNGDDNLELYDGTGTLVDQFGVPGVDGTGTDHEFEDGRAERLASVTSGNITWDVSEWDIDNDSGGGAGTQDAPADFDPAAWIGEVTCTAPSTQATSMNFTSIGDNGMTVNWTGGDGDDGVIVLAKEGSAVDADPTSGTTYTADANFSGSPEEIGTGNYVVYVGGAAGADNVAVTGLNPGTTYHFAVYELNSTGTCYLTPALEGSQATTTSFDTDSDITDPTAQIAGGNISSLFNIEADAADVFTFKLTDSNSGDGSATSVNTIVIEQGSNNTVSDWSAVIAGAKLNDGTDVTVTGTTINSNNITFDLAGNEYSVADNTSKELTLSIWLNTTVTDQEVLEFEIPTNHSFAADATGSTFLTTLAGAVTSNQHIVEVAASIYSFSTQAYGAQTNTAFSLTISAVDGNGNVDVNNIDAVALSKNTGDGTLGTSSNLTQNLASGEYQWSDLTFDENGVHSIDASGTVGTFTSSNISIYTAGDLVLNEILYDPSSIAPNGDANGDGNNSTSEDEFIELVNTGDYSIDLGNWTMADGFSDRHIFTSPTILGAGEVLVLFGGGTPTGGFGGATIQIATSGGIGLNNAGDDIIVSDGTSDVINITYSSGAGDQSINRDPELTGSFTDHSSIAFSGGALFSPGTTANGGTFCTSPSTQATAVAFGTTDESSMVINWTQGNGTDAIVLVKEAGAVDAAPVSGTAYTADANYSGSPEQIGTGNYVVYAGASATQTVTVSGLTAATTYHVAIYEYNSADDCYNISTPATGNNTTSASATLTVVESLTDFGSVDNGNTSSEQTFTIEGTNLTTDIVVTAPSNFEVSLASGSGFASSVSVSPTTGTIATTTIYTHFAPTSGLNGAKADNIVVSTTGVTSENIAVSGTETGNTSTNGPAQVLITEVVVTPTDGEFIEIYNNTGTTVILTDYYLTDATFAGGSTYYYNIVTGSNAGGGGFGDWHARFPNGSSIAAGETQTVSLTGSDAYFATYGENPTYELFEDGGAPDAIPDMLEAIAGSINDQGGLTNSGEIVVLYYWDGATDLVTDIDMVMWGDADEAIDKTGVAIDGPDGDATNSTYQDDFAKSAQSYFENTHSSGFSWQRADYTEGAEENTGGNGVDGNNESSEDYNNTFELRAVDPGNQLGSCTPPSTQASAVTFGTTDDVSMVVNWTQGNGDKALVVMKDGSAVDAPAILSGEDYSAATSVFSDAAVEVGTGNVVVFAGNSIDQTVSVTGLTLGNTYHVAIYEYDDASKCYNKTNPATGNNTTVATAVLTVNASLTDFGTLDNGNISSEQTFTIEGSSLTDDITVTAPVNFEISLVSGSGFGSSVAVSPTTGTVATTTIHTRFAPTSGVNGVKSGNISVSTPGASDENVAVSGTESGNAAAVDAAAQILISELVVTPSGAEFIEIYNNSSETVILENYYLTDATSSSQFYYNIVTGTDAGGGDGTFDFHAKFPSGSAITAGSAQTISINGSDAFFGAYGQNPDYEIYEDGASSDAISDMEEAFSGSLTFSSGNEATLSNGGETAVLYYWDGATDLVTDIDYVVWGDQNEAIDKTGVSVDGPDGDATTSTYLDDTAISSQQVVGDGSNSHASGNSWQRIDFDEGAEVATGGNGVDGNDETSEDFQNTWGEDIPNPGAVVLPGSPVITLDETGLSSNFGFVAFGNSSDIRSYTLEAANLTDDVTITPPNGFEVSTTSDFSSNNGDNSTPLVVARTGDAIATTSIFIRFTPDAADGATDMGDVTHTSTGALDKSIAVQGTEGAATFTNIIDARALSLGTEVSITGIVTTPDYGFSNGQYYVQDATGGINVFHSGNFGLVNSGDEVEITGTIAAFNDLVEIEPSIVSIISSGNALPDPISITESGLDVASANQGMIVEIEGVSLDDDSQWPTTAIAAGSNVDVDATSGSTSFQITIDRGESFYDGSAVPDQPFILKGVLTRDGTNVQILPFYDGDIHYEEIAPGFTLNTDNFNGDFGSVAAMSASDASSYAISAAELTQDFIVEIPAGFEASLTSDFNNTVFSSALPLSITPTSGEISNVTIYVRFAPDAAGSFSGDLVNKSVGYDNVTIAVSGTGTEAVTGIEELVKNNISIYPNPADEVLNIVIPESFGEGEVKLLNLNGAVVLKGAIGSLKSIETSQLRSGIYVLQITNKETVINHRVMVK